MIRRAQRGDTGAFANIFNTHKPRVYSLCLRMTNNVAEAEDLTQEAFLQVFRKLPTFRGDSALSTWMYRVAVNTVLMYFRKRGRPQLSLDEPANQNVKSKKREYGFDDQRLVTSIDRIALTRAIRELPDGYRTIFLLHEIEGYEHREIAKLLKCSVGNSKSQLHKARLKMREILTQSPEGKAVIERSKARPRGVRAELAAADLKLCWSHGKRSGKKAQSDKPVFVASIASDERVSLAA
ncbi:MAG TPA: sigma-70 family RNA polymerase sigma factor [Terriglobales bacterium]|nr:sigma-70 family RNA polymerase sigma factor [Terriglobales bacterium]